MWVIFNQKSGSNFNQNFQYLTNKFLEKHKKPDNIYPNLTIFSTNEEKKHNVNNINISHLNINLQKKFQKKILILLK